MRPYNITINHLCPQTNLNLINEVWHIADKINQQDRFLILNGVCIEYFDKSINNEESWLDQKRGANIRYSLPVFPLPVSDTIKHS